MTTQASKAQARSWFRFSRPVLLVAKSSTKVPMAIGIFGCIYDPMGMTWSGGHVLSPIAVKDVK